MCGVWSPRTVLWVCRHCDSRRRRKQPNVDDNTRNYNNTKANHGALILFSFSLCIVRKRSLWLSSPYKTFVLSNWYKTKDEWSEVSVNCSCIFFHILWFRLLRKRRPLHNRHQLRLFPTIRTAATVCPRTPGKVFYVNCSISLQTRKWVCHTIKSFCFSSSANSLCHVFETKFLIMTVTFVIPQNELVWTWDPQVNWKSIHSCVLSHLQIPLAWMNGALSIVLLDTVQTPIVSALNKKVRFNCFLLLTSRNGNTKKQTNWVPFSLYLFSFKQNTGWLRQ